MTHIEEFYLRHLDREGNVKALAVTSYLRLRYRKVASESGAMSFDFISTDPIIEEIERHDWFEVYRRMSDWGAPWHLAFKGIVLGRSLSQSEEGIIVYTYECQSAMILLDWRQVSYPAGVSNRSTFSDVPSETLFKTVVDYNFTPLASVANGRLRNGDMSTGMGFTITTLPDQGRGAIVSHAFSNGNVGRVFRDDVQPVAGGDIDLIEISPNNFEFEFFPGQLGEDKTSGQNAVVFSNTKNNMVDVDQYWINGVEQRTVAIVGGQGHADERAYAIVEGSQFSPDNDKEYYVDARHEGTSSNLPDDGARRLRELELRTVVEFQVAQTPQVFYSEIEVLNRATYRVGDVVQVVGLDGLQINVKVRAVEVIVYPREPAPTTFITVECETL